MQNSKLAVGVNSGKETLVGFKGSELGRERLANRIVDLGQTPSSSNLSGT